MGKKTLVYGFGPYGKFRENKSEAIVCSLKTDENIVTEIFDTRFDRSMFLRSLKLHAPEVIIGLGQNSRARKLQLERKAVNLWGKEGDMLNPIDKKGPSHFFVNLRLPDTCHTTITYDAGTYVCNFSMYVCLNYCRTSQSRFAFIHVPLCFDVNLAAEYVLKAVHCADEKE